jgi:hypothetical protein
MFGTDFGGKCIIMQFLGMEKDETAPERRDAEAQRKDLSKIREERTADEPGSDECAALAVFR